MHNNSILYVHRYSCTIFAATITAVVNNELYYYYYRGETHFFVMPSNYKSPIVLIPNIITLHVIILYIGNNKITSKDGRMRLYEFLFYNTVPKSAAARNDAAKSLSNRTMFNNNYNNIVFLLFKRSRPSPK